MKQVDVRLVVLTVRRRALEALLVRLPCHVWALPGAAVRPGATLEAAASRALEGQTGVRGIRLEQLYTFDRDGGSGVSVAHLALAPAERHPPTPGPEVVEVRWFPLADLPALEASDARILDYGRARVRAKAAYAPIALDLLPEAFTLAELQAVYEAVPIGASSTAPSTRATSGATCWRRASWSRWARSARTARAGRRACTGRRAGTSRRWRRSAASPARSSGRGP